ncbi:MFS general substrate transporter [Schizophyllum commune Loenen D]|nr:MFS general substrate transporter [Schizophyllum commune Loenen D]
MSGVNMNSQTTINEVAAPQGEVVAKTHKGPRFWLIFCSICLSLFAAALELTVVSTALPTIASDLHIDEFTWVGSAYALASTAFLPMSGAMAEVFGRRPALLFCLACFFLGSGICGGASNSSMMLAGRTVQGLGGGGIQALGYIVLADITTLRERGVYASLFGLTWSIASLIGPIVGGTLADKGQWRWIFYMNLPIAGVASVLVGVLLNLPTPPGSMKEKLAKIDWIGNVIVIGSTTSAAIGLTWGGVTAPWDSAQTLAPLIIGLVGLVFFMVYEAKWAKNPLVPFHVVNNRTSVSGYLQTFISAVGALCLTYMYPVYFQAVKNATPIKSGVYLLGMSALVPAAIVAGVMVKKTGRYRPQMLVGWCLPVIGTGLMSTLHAYHTVGRAIGYLVIVAVGIGAVYSTTMFPIQAPLPVQSSALSLSFMSFVRAFAGIWGVTIGSTVLQNQANKKLPQWFKDQLPGGIDVAYSAIPRIPMLPPDQRFEVNEAFALSLQVVWEVLIGILGLGLLSALLMKGIPLHSVVDQKWTMQENAAAAAADKEKDIEMEAVVEDKTMHA